eukprot:gene1603-1775_t
MSEELAKIHMLSDVECKASPTVNESVANINTEEGVMRVGFTAADSENKQRQLGPVKKPLNIPFTLLLEGINLRKFSFELFRQWKQVTQDLNAKLLERVYWSSNGERVTEEEKRNLKQNVQNVLGSKVCFREGMDMEFLANLEDCVVVLDHPLYARNDAVPIMVIRAIRGPEVFVHWSGMED